MYSGGGGEVLWDTGFARSQGGYATQAERAIQPLTTQKDRATEA